MSAAPATAAAAAAYIAISPVEGIKPPVVMLGGVPVGVLTIDASSCPSTRPRCRRAGATRP